MKDEITEDCVVDKIRMQTINVDHLLMELIRFSQSTLQVFVPDCSSV